MAISLPTFNTVSKYSLQTKFLIGLSVFLFLTTSAAAYSWYSEKRITGEVSSQNLQISDELEKTEAELSSISAQLVTLQTEDQFVRNEKLQAEIKGIENTYKQAVTAYERILDLRGDTNKTGPLEQKFSLVLSQLSQRKESSASATLATLNQDIQKLQAELAVAVATTGPTPENVPASNAPPASGYSRQTVNSEVGQFVVDILSADLNSTRVQVETASESDCRDNCPVAHLADYVARSGGFAGINGPYFCPADYPSCAGKTNSFDTLLMNKNKKYFNSDNNVFSTVPAIIFDGTQVRVVGQSLEWGRTSSVDAVIANQGLLLSGGNIAFGGDGDPKKGSRGARSFIGAKDSTVYIGVVRNATVAEVAYVLKTLGLQSALNLDSGGSTAFYVNGKYVVGPGRQTPFGIVLVRK